MGIFEHAGQAVEKRITEAGLVEGHVDTSVVLGWPPTFLVTLKFNCCISILSLTVTVLYCLHFFPSYTLWLLPFVPSLKSNRVPPGCYATTGIPLGNNAVKTATALTIWVDISGRILSYLICSNVVPWRIILQLVLITPFFKPSADPPSYFSPDISKTSIFTLPLHAISLAFLYLWVISVIVDPTLRDPPLKLAEQWL